MAHSATLRSSLEAPNLLTNSQALLPKYVCSQDFNFCPLISPSPFIRSFSMISVIVTKQVSSKFDPSSLSLMCCLNLYIKHPANIHPTENETHMSKSVLPLPFLTQNHLLPDSLTINDTPFSQSLTYENSISVFLNNCQVVANPIAFCTVIRNIS